MEHVSQSAASSLPASVLVAEDNKINQRILKELLKKEGYTATVVANGKEVLTMLNQQTFPLLILDLHMPELNGLETLKAIRSHPDKSVQTITVLLFTAEQDEKHLQEIQAYGIEHLLQKPINQVQFSQVLQQVSHPSPATPVPMAANRMDYLYSITGGSQPLMIELMDIFIQEVPEAVAKIKDFYQRGQWTSIQTLAHKLRSNYKYVGADEAEQHLKILETDLGNEQNQQQYKMAIHAINTITTQTIEALHQEKQKLL